MSQTVGTLLAKMVLDKSDYTTKMSGAAKETSAFSGSTLSTMGRWAKRFAALTAGAITGIIAYTASYEKALLRTVSVAGGGMDELGAKAREMGRATIYSAKEAATAMYDLASAGLSVGDVIGSIEPSMHLAAATAATLSQATSIMATTMKQFSLDASSATRIADTYTYAIQNSKLTMDSLTEAMKFAGPMGAGFRWSIEETTAAVAEFADIGMHGSMAGTHLRMALMHITAPSKRAQAEMEKLGLKMYEVQAASMSFMDTLKLFADTPLNDPATAGRIFGVRAGNDMLALVRKLRDGTLEYEERLNSLNESAGKASSSYATMTENVADKFKILTSAIGELTIAIGENWRDDIIHFLEQSKGLVNDIIDLVKNNKESISSFFSATSGPASAAVNVIRALIKNPAGTFANIFNQANSPAGDITSNGIGPDYGYFDGPGIGTRAASGIGIGINSSGRLTHAKGKYFDGIDPDDDFAMLFQNIEDLSGNIREFEDANEEAKEASKRYGVAQDKVTESLIRRLRHDKESEAKQKEQDKIIAAGRIAESLAIIDEITKKDLAELNAQEQMKEWMEEGLRYGKYTPNADREMYGGYKYTPDPYKMSQRAKDLSAQFKIDELADRFLSASDETKKKSLSQIDEIGRFFKEMLDKSGKAMSTGVANMLVGIEQDWTAMAQRIGSDMIQGLMRNKGGDLTMFGQAGQAYAAYQMIKSIGSDVTRVDQRPEIDQYKDTVANAEAAADKAITLVQDTLKRVNAGELTMSEEKVAQLIAMANNIAGYDIQDPAMTQQSSSRGGVAGLFGGKQRAYYFSNKDAIDAQIEELQNMYANLGDEISNVEGSAAFEKSRSSPFTGSGTSIINNLNINSGVIVADESTLDKFAADMFDRMQALGRVTGNA